MKYYILFNPLAGDNKCEELIKELNVGSNDDTVYFDMTKISNYSQLFDKINDTDKIIVCGGDGTLNRFVNAIDGLDINNEIFYFAAGSGNDFFKDLNLKTDSFFKVNSYIKNLPYVVIKDKTYRFLNGIGYGIDGYCCEEGNRLRKETCKKINYTLIALKALLFTYKPTNAEVIIDGNKYHYKKVWLAPSMLGKYFGGGMMIAPNQDRFNKQGSLTVVIAHNLSKARILTLFPTIFKGGHIKYKKYIDVFNCHTATVRFDRPSALQIDGETITNVTEYTAKSEAALTV